MSGPQAVPRPRAVLVGPPGAGKTTVGRALARQWRVGFRDTDDDVAAALGASVPEIFVERGEAVFRAAEAQAVRAALAEHDGVLALGGGAVMDDATRAALAGHRVVFLDVSLAAAVPRVGLNRDRPLLLESPRAKLAALMEARRPRYVEVATVTVDTSRLDVADTVLAVLTALEPAP